MGWTKTDLDHLYLYSSQGNVEKATPLLRNPELNPNRSPSGVQGATSLHIAIDRKQNAIVKMLLAHPKIDVNKAMDNGRTPLYDAAATGNHVVVGWLLEHPDIDVNHFQEDGATPLLIAANRGHENVVQLLLKRQDVDVNRPCYTPFQTTPIQQAARSGAASIVRTLLNEPRLKRAELKWNDLHVACATQNALLFYQTLARYHQSEDFDEFNQPDSCGFTPLHFLMATPCLEMVKILLTIPEVSLEMKDVANRTPLWIASHEGTTLNVKWILATGKSVELGSKSFQIRKGLDWSDKSAAEIAKLREHKEIASLIEMFQADPGMVTEMCRKEVNYEETLSSDLLSLLMLLNEGYLSLKPPAESTQPEEEGEEQGKLTKQHRRNQARRFLTILSQLPLELQMLLCNYTCRINKRFIASQSLDPAIVNSIMRHLVNQNQNCK